MQKILVEKNDSRDGYRASIELWNI